MPRKPRTNETKPVTVRVSLPLLELIDEWRRAQSDIPSRGDFLREAAEEKLTRDRLKSPQSETDAPAGDGLSGATA
jgi:Ribbon-helix-helix protein, copG family